MNIHTSADASFDDQTGDPFVLQSGETKGKVIEFPGTSEQSITKDDSELALQKLLRANTVSEERERKLLKAAQGGDDEAMNQLTKHFMPMIVREAAVWVQPRVVGRELCDLVQLASIIFISVAKKFDPKRGFRLASYSATCIHRWLRRYVASRPKRTQSLDEPLAGMEDETLIDQLISPENISGVTQQAERHECSSLLELALRKVTPRQRDLLKLRYQKEMTLAEVGVELGLTRQGCWQREKRGLRKLRKAFAEIVREQFDDWRHYW
jgi:RNA polymerase sigma-70 factor (ECF subfamily)